MTTRHEAAVGALRAHNPFLPDLQAMDDTPSDEFECCSKVALAAADAVMLSDATVERAARGLARETFTSDSRWDELSTESRDWIRKTARAVLAAAVGGGGE